jgi:CRP-like cAMP-binding protein
MDVLTMEVIVSDRSRRPAAGRGGPGERRSPDVRLARGQTLFFEGDPAVFFHEVVAGTMRCCRLVPDGRRTILRFAGPGSFLGIGCVGVYGYTAEAVTEVVVRGHRLSGLEAEMADAGLRARVLAALREELAATRSQMLLLGRMSAAERLAAFLVGYATREPQADGCIELPMTRSDVADHLGLTVETVSRKLHELDDLGLIRIETPSRIRILEPDRIEAIAEAA